MSAPLFSPRFLAPIAADRFMSEYFEKSVLEIHRNDESYFSDVIDLRRLDELVTSVRVPATNLHLAQNNSPIALERYCTGSYVDKTRMLALHHAGATVILRSIEQWCPELNRLRIGAEAFFGCECQINVYVTPAGQQSTPPHWDTHDLIVIQLAGSKVWPLYRGKPALPLPDERFRIGEDAVGSECEDVLLSAGDTLYLPRGTIHAPVAECYSVHASIGIHTVRWHEVANTALQLLAQRGGSALRRCVRFADAEPSAALLAEMASQLAEPAIYAHALTQLRQEFESRRAVDLQGAMQHIAENPLSAESAARNSTLAQPPLLLNQERS